MKEQICRRALLGRCVQGMKGVKVARLNERVWGCVEKAEHVGGLHLVHVGRRFPFLFQIFGIEPQGNEWFGCQQESSPAQCTSERYIRLPLSVKLDSGYWKKKSDELTDGTEEEEEEGEKDEKKERRTRVGRFEEK